MKKRISATIDDKTDKILDKLMRDENFRNKSHIIEKAIRMLGEVTNGKSKK